MNVQYIKSFLGATSILLMSAFSYHSICAEKEQLELLDLDQDGLISIKEAVAEPYLLAIFGKIDVNADAYISAEELARFTSNQQTAKIRIEDLKK